MKKKKLKKIIRKLRIENDTLSSAYNDNFNLNKQIETLKKGLKTHPYFTPSQKVYLEQIKNDISDSDLSEIQRNILRKILFAFTNENICKRKEE